MERNKVVCPRCGEVRQGEGGRSRPPGGGDLLETPVGTTVLPTLGMARKATGKAGQCDCGKAPHERPGAGGRGSQGTAADAEA